MIPHRVQLMIDLKTGKSKQRQLTRKECAIGAITEQPFFGGIISCADRIP